MIAEVSDHPEKGHPRGPLLDRLGVVAEADRRGLRPIGPGGHTGGECGDRTGRRALTMFESGTVDHLRDGRPVTSQIAGYSTATFTG